MTVTELGSSYAAPSGPGESFDRTPPQDVAAEQSVLGGMMLSKDAIADVIEVLRSTDFYRPAHELIFDAVLELYGRGEPADAVTVSDELTKKGSLARVGGAPYLHTLISSVPTAANAGYYARIVRERAVLRRLVEAGTKIVQLGYATTGGDVDDLVNAAQSEVYAVTERRTSEDYLPIGQLIEATVDEIEAAGHRGEGMIGVPTGFADLDRLTNGLHPGQMIVLAARPAIGKALALDTLLATPTGWTTMGEVAVGDQVIGADGRPTRVVAVTEVMAGRPCFQLYFCDGSMIVADAEHQWLTDHQSSNDQQAVNVSVHTTAEIARTVTGRTPAVKHRVATTAPLDLPTRALSVAPYSLGAWLGAGTSSLATLAAVDPEIVMRTEAGEPMGVAQLAAIGVTGEAHIPAQYLRSGNSQRRDLLAGLLDTAGGLTSTGLVQLTTTNLRLAEGFRELVVSLGHRCRVSHRPGRRGPLDSHPAFTLSFSTDDEVFWVERKRLAHKESCLRGVPDHGARQITEVRAVHSVPVRCIEVDAADHLYLAGGSMIPTHNSTLGLDIARSASIRHGLTSVIFSLEMSRTEITMRMLSAEAKIPLQKLRQGRLEDTDWTKLARTMGELSDAPLFIDDSPNMSLMEIRAKCRRLKQRHDLKIVIIDYLQLMSSGKRVESRQQEVSEFSRALKLLAKELEVPVIAISQLNRGPEQRTDKKPQMSDLRESGSIEQDADMVILLHREDAYERESPRAGEADFIVAKHRNGPTDTITVAFQGHYSRFVDMAQS